MNQIDDYENSVVESDGGSDVALCPPETCTIAAETSIDPPSLPSHSDNLRTDIHCLQALMDCVDYPLVAFNTKSADGDSQFMSISGGARRLFNELFAGNKTSNVLSDLMDLCANACSQKCTEIFWKFDHSRVFSFTARPIGRLDWVYLVRITAIKRAESDDERMQAALKRGLSPREAKVFVMMARGRGNQEIALSLSLSYHTIRAHVRNIYKKLNVSCSVEAISKVLIHHNSPA